MRVLIADLFSKDAIEQMQAGGMNVHYNDKLAGEALDKALAEHNPQVLVVRSTKVPAATIDAGAGL
jgi:D-3-phosphoglycerate dehydrogenase / 2-oxoglutarate reductase